MLYTVASALYIIKLLYNSTVSMVTDAIASIVVSFERLPSLNKLLHVSVTVIGFHNTGLKG